MPRDRQSPTVDQTADARQLEEVAFELHSAMLHMMRRVRREDEAFGLSAPRMSALSCVAFGTPRTLGQLAAMEQVTTPTMTRLVDRLEAHDLVTRRGDERDRRIVWIHATARGRRVIEEGRRRRVAFLVSRLRELPASELQVLASASEVLHRIYEASSRG